MQYLKYTRMAEKSGSFCCRIFCVRSLLPVMFPAAGEYIHLEKKWKMFSGAIDKWTSNGIMVSIKT